MSKRRPGYASFALDDPPLKLVLFENPDAGERLNHVGFELDPEEIDGMVSRIEARDVPARVLRDETCCDAKKTTLYTQDPAGLLWEFDRVRGDSAEFGDVPPPIETREEPSERDRSA